MKKLTAAGMNWAQDKPNNERAEAIQKVLPVAQKLGMDRSHVVQMFDELEGTDMTTQEMTDGIIKVLSGLSDTEDELLRYASGSKGSGDQ